MNDTKRVKRLQRFSLICWILLIPAAFMWGVNLELAIRILAPGYRFAELWMPASFFNTLAYFGSDLSTISTLIPLLLVGFPLYMARKIIRFPDSVEDRLRHLIYDPYPPHFPFFLVMLGLAGTLYGLLIGLDVSGVEKLGSEIASPEMIQVTLDRLLGGTATALLSSLLGLAGAFLAARPFTWIFHLVVGMPQDEESAGISETLQHLIQDLQGLGDATRSFGSQLSRTEIEAIPPTLRAIHEELKTLGSGLDAANQHIKHLRESQTAGQERLAPLEHLNRISSLENLLGELKTSQDQSNNGQSELIQILKQSLDQQNSIATRTHEELTGLRHDVGKFETLLTDMEGQGRQAQHHLSEITRSLDDLAGQTKATREQAKTDAAKTIRLLETEQERKQADRSTLHKAAGMFLEGPLSSMDKAESTE